MKTCPSTWSGCGSRSVFGTGTWISLAVGCGLYRASRPASHPCSHTPLRGSGGSLLGGGSPGCGRGSGRAFGSRGCSPGCTRPGCSGSPWMGSSCRTESRTGSVIWSCTGVSGNGIESGSESGIGSKTWTWIWSWIGTSWETRV